MPYSWHLRSASKECRGKAAFLQISRLQQTWPALARVFIASTRYYYDGMMWSSLFVPWRGAKEDHIVKVSGIGGVMRLHGIEIADYRNMR